MDEFSDIKEVESGPKRRIRHRNHNHMHDHTHRHTNEQMHDHTHDHIRNPSDYHNNQNDQHNIQNNIENNSSQNNNNNIKLRRITRKRILFVKHLGCSEKLLIPLFLISCFVLFFSLLINIILTIKGVVTPKIFLPSIVIFIATFMFSGGMLGTLVSPPPGHRAHFHRGEIFMIRTLSPLVMLVISIIFFFFSLNNLQRLKINIKRAQKICESHPGLSMEEIYNRANTTNTKLEEQKYELIYLFNKNLVCFPKGKCIKLTNDENNYICNTNEFITYNNITDVDCKKINYNNNENISIYNNKNSKLFFENCHDITKNNLSNIEMFECKSKYNLEKIKFLPNWNEKEKIKIEDFYNNKLDNCMIDIEKNKNMMHNYENSNYDYDLECYETFDYKLTYFMINCYYIAYYFVSFSWILLGIVGIYNLFKFVKNDEININMSEIRGINGIREENNRLMEVQNVTNNDRYIELSTNSSE